MTSVFKCFRRQGQVNEVIPGTQLPSDATISRESCTVSSQCIVLSWDEQDEELVNERTNKHNNKEKSGWVNIETKERRLSMVGVLLILKDPAGESSCPGLPLSLAYIKILKIL